MKHVIETYSIGSEHIRCRLGRNKPCMTWTGRTENDGVDSWERWGYGGDNGRLRIVTEMDWFGSKSLAVLRRRE